MRQEDNYTHTQTHTHLEHLEDLEEASVWEEGAAADTYTVSTPESHRTDEPGLISSQGV